MGGIDKSLEISEILPLRGEYQGVIRAACYMAREGTRPLVVFTWSGRTAVLAAKARPSWILCCILNAVLDQLRLAYGVQAKFHKSIQQKNSSFKQKALIDKVFVKELMRSLFWVELFKRC